MNVFNLLKELGLFSNELKARFANKQIKVNGDAVDRNHDVDVARNDAGNVIKEDVGDFIFHNIIPNDIWTKRVELFGLTELFDSNINNDLTEFLSDFILLKTSKKDGFIIKLDNENISNDRALE